GLGFLFERWDYVRLRKSFAKFSPFNIDDRWFHFWLFETQRLEDLDSPAYFFLLLGVVVHPPHPELVEHRIPCLDPSYKKIVKQKIGSFIGRIVLVFQSSNY